MDVAPSVKQMEPRYHIIQQATASKCRKPTEGTAKDLVPGEAVGV